MGDDKKQQELHKADLEQATQQVGAVDGVVQMTKMLDVFHIGGDFRPFATTDFEGHRLNDMIDMVESANPEHLEHAGNAMWDARDAISSAAEELNGHVKHTDWEGESGTAFQTWAGNLVKSAHELAGYAEFVGTQITAAGSGLASVRSSMPPRDTRIDPKTVADIPAPKRVESNHEYVAAVKVEGHRQEAINQMNRLASFYKVSEGSLQSKDVPTFHEMPNVGVPRPTHLSAEPPAGHGSTSLSTTSEPGSAHHHSVGTSVGQSHSDSALSPAKHVDGSVTHPDRHVGTAIDSVSTLPPQETAHQTTVTPPSVTGPSGNPVGMTPPFASGPVPPAFGGPTGRTSGFGESTGGRTPVSAQGRVGANPAGTSGGRAGRGPTGQVGRAATTGQAGARGATSASGKSPMGRSVTGGMPRAGGTAAGRAGNALGGRAGGLGSTGAGRTNGVVGGKPTTRATPGETGSRLPRGTVVGGEGTAGTRAAGERLSQRGVIGASNPTTATGAEQMSRRSMSNPDGVVGAPKGRISGARNSGVTPGGTGLARGPVSTQGPDHSGSKGASRRERSTEDETRSHSDARREAPSATD